MQYHSLAILSLLVGSSVAYPVLSDISTRQTTSSCATGVHMIVARGSTEAPGEGPIVNVTSAVEAAIPGSDSVAVVYPATLLPYASSEEAGVKNMTTMVQQYAQSCPNTKIALLGFSQGAQVIGDTLGGGTFGLFSKTTPLPNSVTKNIVAVVQFADPAHVAGKPYNVGTGTNNGIFSRANTTALDTYAPILVSYCEDNDIVCDDGLSVSVHTSEVQTNQAAAIQFVISKVNGS